MDTCKNYCCFTTFFLFIAKKFNKYFYMLTETVFNPVYSTGILKYFYLHAREFRDNLCQRDVQNFKNFCHTKKIASVYACIR